MQRLGEAGGLDHGVAAAREVATDVRRAAGDGEMVVAATHPRRSETAIGERRLVGEGEARAGGERGEARRRAGAADLLVGGQQHLVAEPGCSGVLLERRERGKHDGEAALHVGDAGAVQRAVATSAHRGEARAGGIDRVVVPGQHDASRGLRADAQSERLAARSRDRLAPRVDLDPVGQREAVDPPERPERRLERIGLRGKALLVVTAARDGAPSDCALDGGLAEFRGARQHRLIGGADTQFVRHATPLMSTGAEPTTRGASMLAIGQAQ